MNTDIKIFIVDDSAFMRKILREILEGAGFSQIIECGNGKECIERYDAEKPGLVFLDMIMPEMDGMEVLKKIGSIAKVIVISAVGQEKTLEEAKRLGAQGYIIKPFDHKRVLKETERVLG